MDAINPWLDPSEVRNLAEQLLRPVPPTRLAAADPGFNASFIGFTHPESPTPPTQPLLQPDSRTQSPPSTLPPSSGTPPESSPSPPPPAPSRTRFLERIRIFRDWLAKNFHATEIFILDREGKVIFDESVHGRFHFMARNLALASRGTGNIHVKIGPGSILEVLPCETPYGRIILGALLPASLPPGHVRIITDVLLQTASPA